MTDANLAGAEISDDGLLDGRLRLRQPLTGYRAGSDAVFLAAAVPARPGQHALDAGCGVGAVAACLAYRVDHIRVTGIELQPMLAGLARENAVRNGLADRITVETGDVGHPPSAIAAEVYDHVACNPPFYEAGRAQAAHDPVKTTAHIEGNADLSVWLQFCLARLRPGGTLTVIHRSARLVDLLAGLAGRAGDIVVFPLWPGAGRPAKRVLVQATKGGRGPSQLAPGLVLHGPGGGYTSEADEVLRRGAALPLKPS